MGYKNLDETKAIKIFLLPYNHYNVDPPIDLAEKAKKLPIYKKHYSKPSGLMLRSEGELLLWIESIAKLKQKMKK